MQDCDVEIISMKEAGVYEDIEENGSTFEENALIKASAIAKKTGILTLADDSGLEVDYLDKAPGIFSARYLGEDTPYSVKNKAIIDALEGVPDEKRSARFVCAVAAVKPDGTKEVVRATMEGRVAYKTAGENGFGYDPLFFIPEKGCTSAELTAKEKNEISHRGKALKAMRDKLFLQEN